MFVRNPNMYDTKSKRNTNYKPKKVNSNEVDAYINNIRSVLQSNRYYDRQAKAKINENLEMIVYLLKHPIKSNFDIKAKVQRVVKILKPIKGIDLKELRECVPYDIK